MTSLQSLQIYSSPRRCGNHRGREAGHVKLIATPCFQRSPWSRHHGRISNQFHRLATRKAPRARVRLKNGERRESASPRATQPGKVDYAAMDVFIAFALPTVAVVASSALYHPVILFIVLVLVVNPYTNSQIVIPLIRVLSQSMDMMFLHRNPVDVTNCGKTTRQTSTSNSGGSYYKPSNPAGFSLDSDGLKESTIDIPFSGETSTGLQRREPTQVFQNQKVVHQTSLNSFKTNRSPYIDFLVRWLLSIFPFLRYWGGRL